MHSHSLEARDLGERAVSKSYSESVYLRAKYALERALAGVLLVALSPLIVALIALVRLTSKGPGLYRQERVGLNRKPFYVIKLRTMYDDAEADGQAKWSQKGDPRITPLGRFLRKTHLDELPQLWNVFTGDMSMTGPRPERPCICARLSKHIPNYYSRILVKPGITGISQINLEPDRTIDDVRRKQCLDLHYIETLNCWLDVRIVFATLLRVFGIRGDLVTKWMGLCRKSVLESNGLSTKALAEQQHAASDRKATCDGSETEFNSMVAIGNSKACSQSARPR